MKINKITNVYTPKIYNDNRQKSPRILQTKDTFVKSPAFAANHLQKVDMCTGLLQNHILSEDVDLSKIEAIFKQFIPDLTVRSMSELPKELNPNGTFIAYTSIEYAKPDIIYLDSSKGTDKNNRIKLLGSSVHEFTHAAQNKELRFSPTAFIDKAISSYPDSPSLRAALQQMGTFSKDVELYALYPLYKGIKNETELPVAYKGSENKLLQKFTAESKIGHYDKYIDNILINRFSQAAEGNLNLRVLLDYLQMFFVKELEAYTKETEILKKVTNMGKQTTDFDVRNFAYSKIIQRCIEFRKKFVK